MDKTMEKIVSLSKNRGFIFPGSEIYGGLANTWDYGPLGVELKNNVKKAWWKKFIQESNHNVGMDSGILMNPKTWEASGHISSFNDPLMDCKDCKTRFRADNLIEDWFKKNDDGSSCAGWDNERMQTFIADSKIPCPSCGKNNFTNIRRFNLMFKTFQGVTEDSAAEIHLRPETAQGIFVNFKNVLRSSRKKLPFGIGQIGKSFRNEITPGNFIFRTREFEQMELEFFCKAGEDMDWFLYWRNFCKDWLISLNMDIENVRLRDHTEDELSHYSLATTDIEYRFPFGWGELWGIANRTDYDLKQHAEFSGENFNYLDPVTNEQYIPYCIEPSLGADRVLLAFLCDAYNEEILPDGETRSVLKFHPFLAPYKAAVLPLVKKLKEPAEAVFNNLKKYFSIDYDETGSIGKRYRRQDEAGTPFCITVDFDTLNDNAVTVRDRDSMTQVRIPCDKLKEYLDSKLEF